MRKLWSYEVQGGSRKSQEVLGSIRKSEEATYSSKYSVSKTKLRATGGHWVCTDFVAQVPTNADKLVLHPLL